jgi:hypothetical protein
MDAVDLAEPPPDPNFGASGLSTDRLDGDNDARLVVAYDYQSVTLSSASAYRLSSRAKQNAAATPYWAFSSLLVFEVAARVSKSRTMH